MLTLRKRGKTWHLRGSVRVGRETRQVLEHSTGFADRASAESYRAKLQRETEQGILHGAPLVRRQITFADAALSYLDGPRHLSDLSRVRQLEQFFRGSRLPEIDSEGFARFCREVLPGRSPNTLERTRITLSSIFKTAGVKFPEIPAYGVHTKRIRWLSLEHAERLGNRYAPHVQPIALVARDCGLRASENLRLTIKDCRPEIGDHGAFFVGDGKNGEDRIAPWTPRVRLEVLHLMHKRDGREHLWLNRYRRPYADTRKQGGNPLSSAHGAACRSAGVLDFHWHDWRHHYATWALQPEDKGGFGWDLLELQTFGGWRDLNTVQRYATAMLEGSMENVGTTRAR